MLLLPLYSFRVVLTARRLKATMVPAGLIMALRPWSIAIGVGIPPVTGTMYIGE